MEKDKNIQEAYNNKLKNKLFGLLCEYEKNRELEKFLDSILIELSGYSEEEKTINYYILYYKLSSLRFLKYSIINFSHSLKIYVQNSPRYINI